MVMLIESLGAGGAERQICILAVEMERRGHDVHVVTYAPGNFYAPILEHAGIKHTFLGGIGTLQWLHKIRRFLRSNHQEVVLAFLGSCSIYAELSSLPFRQWGLVVSERASEPRLPAGSNRLRKKFHLLADAITTNSHTNRLMLEAVEPSLKSRIVTIYNAVDLDKFKPGNSVYNSNKVRLIVAARFVKEKNVLRTIEAIDLLRNQKNNISVSLDWFGSPSDDVRLWSVYLDLIKKRRLEKYFRVHEPTLDIVTEYQRADAVMLPSLHEGLPNTICEAMACGKPILMSYVCDAGNLVKEGENGFLFSPEDPADIARVIQKFISLTQAERLAMGKKSREMAEQYFDIGKITNLYESVLNSASRRQRPDCGHWLPEVPQTALAFVKNAST